MSKRSHPTTESAHARKRAKAATQSTTTAAQSTTMVTLPVVDADTRDFVVHVTLALTSIRGIRDVMKDDMPRKLKEYIDALEALDRRVSKQLARLPQPLLRAALAAHSSTPHAYD
jgi:predicted component of type VI protein secretion system